MDPKRMNNETAPDHTGESDVSGSGHNELCRKVRKLYARCYSAEQIADEMKVGLGTVRKVLHELIDNARSGIDCKLLRIEDAEIEYWEAWNRSKRGKSTREHNNPNPEDGKSAETQAGDPRFLQGVVHCIEKQMDIIKEKYRESDSDDAPKRVLDLSKATPEEMLILSNIIHREDANDTPAD